MAFVWDHLRKLGQAAHRPKYSGESSVINVHPMLNVYEVLSFILVIPGLFIVGPGVLFVMLNMGVAISISRGERILPLILIFVINLPTLIIGALIGIEGNSLKGALLFTSIPLILIVTGCSAIYFETKRMKEES